MSGYVKKRRTGRSRVKHKKINSKKDLIKKSEHINAVFQTVEHDLTREEAMHYADTLDRFFSKAWREFFGY